MINETLNNDITQEVRLISVEQFHKTKLCPHMNKPEGCLRSMRTECPYAHSPEELKEPPNLLKTAMCKLHMRGCCNKLPENCPYAHSYLELRHTDGFYKTYLCKFWQKGHCKAGNMCRYAHGVHELRRPSIMDSTSRMGDMSPLETLRSQSLTEDDETVTKLSLRDRESTSPTLLSGYSFNRGMSSPMVLYPFYAGINNYSPTPTNSELQAWLASEDATTTKEQEEAYCLMHFYLQKYIDCCSKQQSMLHHQLYLDHDCSSDNTYKN
ncbi:uncharacterized protein BXIN_1126 [Babesia sp. Xinjiang]|uniref:uncharacterized protein n=1 Tax=Babesia sp. Xinjiang TaxID=462227 RepID=UPI000A24F155|nr:uncharacterized protein BXIN_1126 [Babesia sp. Xinjiang]ORM42343.1 hypothetical protein BXIN_1126 [Babesia sp. Xinjiang]